jgi:transglutaminase-like putative cysteine protease
MKKILFLILLISLSIFNSPRSGFTASENYKILLFDETITVLDDLTVHVQLDYEFTPLLEAGYYYDSWKIYIHTADADHLSVEDESGPLQFDREVEGNRTLLSIDLGRQVFTNDTYLLRISYYANDRIKTIGPEKTLAMWTIISKAYKENITLTVNIPKTYSIIQYEPSFLTEWKSTDQINLSGQMLGVEAEEQYYLKVMIADTSVQYETNYRYTFTNEGSETEDDFEIEIPGPFETELQDILQLNCTPAPVSTSYDDSGNPRYKFVVESVAPGTQTTITMNLILKIRLPQEINESYSKQLDEISSDLLVYTTADEYWEVDDTTINTLSHDLTYDKTSVQEKVKAIYNYVVDNIEYDYDKLKRQQNREPSDRYGAIQTNALKKGVCEDYSDLFVTLCRASGIPAIVVEGFSYERDGQFPQEKTAHSWVEAYIPEYGWLQVDPTWGIFGRLEGRHISELVKMESSEFPQVVWRAGEPFSYEMNYQIELLETKGSYSPELEIIATYEDETPFTDEINLDLNIQNLGNGTSYSTRLAIDVAEKMTLLNESIYNFGNIYSFESNDLNLIMIADSPGQATIEASIEYRGEEGDTEIIQYMYSISLTKTPTKIVYVISPIEGKIGEQSSFQGSIDPPIPDKVINLEITKPDGEITTIPVTTEADGSYSLSFTPSTSGSWSAIASWEGDSNYLGATSQAVEFTVVDPSSSEDEKIGNGGIPGFSVQSIILGLLFGYLLIWFARAVSSSTEVNIDGRR